MADEFNHLNKEDLYLLMESYRNMIQMHSTVSEQQRQIIDLQNNILSKQETISLYQSKSCDHLDRITQKLEICSVNLSKTNDVITSSCSSLDKTFDNGLGDIKDKLVSNQIESTSHYSKLTTKSYVTMGAMITVVISLIGLVVGLLDKYQMLKEVHTAIFKLLAHFHIVL